VRAKRHLLYEVDLERRPAFCTACGYTEIYVPSTRIRPTPKPICITRAKEIKEEHQEKKSILDEEKRLLPTWRPRHTLSEIDPIARTAICAVCGPTDVWKTTNKGIGYVCGRKYRDYEREPGRNRYVGRSSNPHALSQIDEEKGTAICAKCGPVEIEIRYGRKNIRRRCINAGKEIANTPPTHGSTLSYILNSFLSSLTTYIYSIYCEYENL
jgi:hypothetical protein